MKTISSTHIINPLRRTFAWTSLLLSTVHGNYGMLDPKELEKALNGESPLYGISVTRSTKDNLESEYKSLQDSQIHLIMSVLKAVLGRPMTPETFKSELDSILEKEVDAYNHLNHKITERIRQITDHEIIKDLQRAIENSSPHIPKETWELIWQRLHNNPQDPLKDIALKSFQINQIKQRYNELFDGSFISEKKQERILKTLSKLEQQLLEYWRLNTLDSIVQQYTQMYHHTFHQLQHSEISKHLAKMQSSIGFVALNEMFFGKSVAFPKARMEQLFESFSKEFKDKLFFVNVLVESQKVFNTLQEKNEFIDQQLARSRQERYFQHKEETQDDHQLLNRYHDTMRALKENTEILSINILENMSVIYYAGLPLTYYRKSTYFEEEDTLFKGNDKDLTERYVYVLGDKHDHPTEHTPHPDHTTIQALQKILLRHVATEICYDLELGVRKEADTYSENLTFHLVQSNTLPFKDSILDRLPQQTKLVWHVDPKNTEILMKVPTLDISQLQGMQQEWQPFNFKHLELPFKLGKSSYEINVGELTPVFIKYRK